MTFMSICIGGLVKLFEVVQLPMSSLPSPPKSSIRRQSDITHRHMDWPDEAEKFKELVGGALQVEILQEE